VGSKVWEGSLGKEPPWKVVQGLRLKVQAVRAVHLPIKVPGVQAVNLRIKEKEVREFLPHLAREQAEGSRQVLHQGKEEQEDGGVPLMVLRSHRKKVVEENPLVEEGLHRVEQEAGEGARLTLQLLALQAEQEVEVVHSILPLLLTVHLRKKEPVEDPRAILGPIRVAKGLKVIHSLLPPGLEIHLQRMGEGEDRAILARDHRIPLGILELPKLKVKEQEVLPSLRLPQLGEARLRMARRPGLNFLRWGEERKLIILFQEILVRGQGGVFLMK
jgi:hypothetical protein